MRPSAERLGRAAAGPAIAAVLVAGFCLLLLWHDAALFWVDDLQIYYAPIFEDLHRAAMNGERQILSPCSWTLNNIAGESQFGTFSIFVTPCVLALWSLPLALPLKAALLSIAHMIVLAAGIFVLARRRGLAAPFALLATFAGALNGWIICWGATDWITSLMSFAWLPWAWWAFESCSRGKRMQWRCWLAPGLFIHLLLTGGGRAALMLVALTVWLAVRDFTNSRSVRSLAPLGVGWLLGLGLAAPALSQLLVHWQGSARGGWGHGVRAGWTVPWQGLPGFVMPSWPALWPDRFGVPTPHLSIELACGLAPVAAAIAGLLVCRREWWRAVRWAAVLFLIVLAISMLPSVSPFRWSFRWLPLVHLVLALIGAKSCELLWKRRLLHAAPIAAMALIAFMLAAGFRISFPAAATPVHIVMVLLTLTWIAASIWCQGRWQGVQVWAPAGVTFFTLLATYWWLPVHQSVKRFDFNEQILEPGPLSLDRLYFSFYQRLEVLKEASSSGDPNYGSLLRPGNTPAFAGLHFVNGYSSFGPAGVSQLFKFTFHGSPIPLAANRILTNHAGPRGLLELMGVDGLILGNGYKQNGEELWPEWRLFFTSAEADVYHRIGPPLGRVHSPEMLPDQPGVSFAPLGIQPVSETRERVTVDVLPAAEESRDTEEDIGLKLEATPQPRKSIVTFSRPWLPGYRAAFNQQPVEVRCFHELLPFVELPSESRGRLVLEYRPTSLVIGYAIACACGVAMLALSFLAPKDA